MMNRPKLRATRRLSMGQAKPARVVFFIGFNCTQYRIGTRMGRSAPIRECHARARKEHDTVPELQVIARHTMAAGKEEEVLPLYPKLIAASTREPGNVSFVAYRQLDDDREIVLLERYASRQAVGEHRARA